MNDFDRHNHRKHTYADGVSFGETPQSTYSSTTRSQRSTRSQRLTRAARGVSQRGRNGRAGLHGSTTRDQSNRGRTTAFVSPSRFDNISLVIFGFFALALVAVIFQLVKLQVVEANSLRTTAEARRQNVITIHAKRGTIYDRNGNVLAMSQDCKTIYCNPQELNDPSGAAQLLADVLGGEASDYLDSLRGSSTFSYVKRQVDTKDAEAISEQLSQKNIKGVYFLDDTKRIYPYGSVGSQVLGTVGIDGDGLSGLELYYNDVLKGTDGETIFETGAGGTPIAGESSDVQSAHDGTDIVISLDIGVQEVAEKSIVSGVEDYDAESGSVMVTNPKTGEILAACSTPLFDVTDTSHIESGALNLKPVSSSFEPGSIFKILTEAIALESHTVSDGELFSVPPTIAVGDGTVRDDDYRSYTMDMDLREILRRSSNVGVAKIAQERIGADTFAAGIEHFHIGTKTGIDFPGEVDGLVKSRMQYDGASLGSMSFGQSLAIPLVQMVQAVGSVANDGTIQTPHFLVSKGGQQSDWPSKGTSISPETAELVTDYMRTVVQEGTAKDAQVPGYDIAGKTGTGEQAGETGGYIADRFVSSLIGFAPADDPEVLVYVGLNGTPYLAMASAAPVFSTIMGDALSNMGIQPTS